MADSEYMSVISKLHEVDPVFREVCSLLYGDAVDPREAYDVAKRSSSSSAAETRRKNERTQARVGLASNVVGLGAGVVGTAAALRDGRMGSDKAPKALQAIHAAANNHVPKVFSRAKGRHAAILAGGALGLQVLNVGGDAVANRVLSRASKDEVRKALAEAIDPILAARREGQISAETAITMASEVAEEISKWTPPGIVRAAQTVVTGRAVFAVPPTQRARNSVKRVAGMNPVTRANQRANVSASNAADASVGRKYALRATGVAAGGTAGTVGYVQGKKKGRNQIMAGVAKADDNLVDYTFVGEISKTDTHKRLAFGWCHLSEVDGQQHYDLQGDYAPIEEIEKSAYAYVHSSRKGGDMHARDGDGPKHTADLVESMVVTPEKLAKMGLSEEVAKSVPTGWWIGMRVNDDAQWAQVLSGERAGFSIHGKGSRVSKVVD